MQACVDTSEAERPHALPICRYLTAFCHPGLDLASLNLRTLEPIEPILRLNRLPIWCSRVCIMAVGKLTVGPLDNICYGDFASITTCCIGLHGHPFGGSVSCQRGLRYQAGQHGFIQESGDTHTLARCRSASHSKADRVLTCVCIAGGISALCPTCESRAAFVSNERASLFR